MVAVNVTVDPRDRERLSAQCESVLALLKAKPRSAFELAAVALNYRARVSELRQAGWDITADRQAHGAALYTLRGRLQSSQLDLLVP